MTVLCVLPARIGSRRLPRKPLQILAGRPLIEWTWRAASRVSGVEDVWVATDDQEIADRVRGFGGEALLTDRAHPSGTDRVAEVARRPEAARFDVFVNLQADEPFLPAGHVAGAIAAVEEGKAGIATLATPFRSVEEFLAESNVKVARACDGRALYFSRAPIPWTGPGEGGSGTGDVHSHGLRHVGLYVYTREALERWVALPPSPLERLEQLEQLRPLEAGMHLHVCVAGPCEAAVDVPEDLERAERLLAARHTH